MICRGADGHGRVVRFRRRINRRQWSSDQLSGACDIGFADGTGEQSVMADAVEALWQDMKQKAPDELVGRQCHCAKPCPAGAAVILVAKGHAALIEADQPTV